MDMKGKLNVIYNKHIQDAQVGQTGILLVVMSEIDAIIFLKNII